jgi:hypothetical protein
MAIRLIRRIFELFKYREMLNEHHILILDEV